ncbi:glycosyltransferase [Pseudarthrobacter sp. NamB4]|uniref:glycosyltransferase n=1 Tax=Pseudarthrobacter sp. NamB4 TaxID=2576837 RepID=UPI0010FEC535|nr:glycosyltransferase [Pseudarthrobacter sp. NamB4]TLM72966.1 glycosyltransferase [Pseudarthrobacter sp. NamB4]
MRISKKFSSDKAIAGFGFLGAALMFPGAALAFGSQAFAGKPVATVVLLLVGAAAFVIAGAGLLFRAKENRRHQRESQASIKKYLLAIQRQLGEIKDSRAAGPEVAKGGGSGPLALRQEAVAQHEGASIEIIKRINDLEAAYSERLQAAENRSLARHFALVAAEGKSWDIFSTPETKMLAETQYSSAPLAVYEMLEVQDCFSDITTAALRGLATELRKLGYTTKSQHVLKVVLERTPNEKLTAAIALREEEVKVFSGAFKPQVQGLLQPFEAKPNCVLHVVGKVLPTTQSGYTLRTHYTALAQIQTGLEVHVCNQVGDVASPQAYERVELGGVTYHLPAGPARLSTSLTQWLSANVEELAQVVAEVRPSVLHAHSDFFNALSARAVGDFFGIPVIYESRGFWEESWLSRMAQTNGIKDIDAFSARWGVPDTYAWRRELEHASRMAADHVFTLAEVMKRRITGEGCPPEKISVVPNAVSGDQFPVQSRNPELASSLGIEDGEIVIGYISSLLEYEGVPVLLEAFSKLRQRLDIPVKILIVGDGPVLGSLKATAESLGLTDAIFTGRVAHEQILSYYGLIDLFVVPRTTAAVCQLVTPLKPFEAFATGRSVVMSDVDALKEIAEASGSAALFTAGSSTSLADVLIELVGDPEARKRMADSGAAWVRQSRSWEANADTYNVQYKSLALDAIPT